MELLKEINEKDLGLTVSIPGMPDNVRRAARIILFNYMNRIAVLHVSKDRYHKLPGGGIENEENIYEALSREVREEVGAKAEVLGEVGVTIEYRERLLQISYCYYGKLIGETEAPDFTEEELSNGFELKWLDIDTAVELISNDKPLSYIGKFIRKRDFCFLKSYMDKHGTCLY